MSKIIANLYKYEEYPFVRQNWVDVLDRYFQAKVNSISTQREYVNSLKNVTNSIIFESNHFSFLYPNILLTGRNKNKFIHFFTDDDQYFFPFSRYFALYYHLSVYTYSKIYQDKLYEKHKLNAKLVPYGANKDIFYPVKSDKIYDVIFIGSSHIPQRVKVIKFLKENGINIKVFGKGWESIKEFSDIYGGFVKDDDMAKIYSKAKIVINFLGTLENKCILKGKVFETAMCKTFQIVEECEEVKFWLKNKESIIFYKNLDDLLEIIRYYLKYPDKREKIVENAYNVVKQFDWESIFLNLFQEVEKYNTIPYYSVLEEVKKQRIFLLNISNKKIKLSNNLLPNITVIEKKEFKSFLENIKKEQKECFVSFIQNNVYQFDEKVFFQVYSLMNDIKDNIKVNIASYEIFVLGYSIYRVDFHKIKSEYNFDKYILPSCIMVHNSIFSDIDINKIKSPEDFYNEIKKFINNKKQYRYISLGKELLIVKIKSLQIKYLLKRIGEKCKSILKKLLNL
jgi:hypothetical protein